MSDLLFHRWNDEAIAEKAAAAKGSNAKKVDYVESYLYRTEEGDIGLPGEYVRQACIAAAKFQQDPRSTRKTAFDLAKAAIVSLTTVASLGVKNYDYDDKRRVTIMRAGITRTRPAMKAGWKATMEFMVNIPEYVRPKDGALSLYSLLAYAGRIVGVGDFRPTYGRFVVTKFEVVQE